MKAITFNRPSGIKIRRRYIGVLIAAALLIGFGLLVKSIIIKNKQPVTISNDKIKIPEAKKTKVLNKEYAFPLKNDKGEEVAKIKYVLESAELRDTIIVKGQKASSIEGRTFLIINMKLVNEFDKPVDINTKDYVRLIVNGNDKELLAPDIHNDPVSVQPISTKFTRVGFPINDSDKNLKLQVGEVKGDKKTIDIIF